MAERYANANNRSQSGGAGGGAGAKGDGDSDQFGSILHDVGITNPVTRAGTGDHKKTLATAVIAAHANPASVAQATCTTKN